MSKRQMCKDAQGTNLAIRSFFVCLCIHLFLEDRPSSQSRISTKVNEIKIASATKYLKYHLSQLCYVMACFYFFAYLSKQSWFEGLKNK